MLLQTQKRPCASARSPLAHPFQGSPTVIIRGFSSPVKILERSGHSGPPDRIPVVWSPPIPGESWGSPGQTLPHGNTDSICTLTIWFRDPANGRFRAQSPGLKLYAFSLPIPSHD